MRCILALSLIVLAANPQAGEAQPHRDDFDPYYPNRSFPKLITPQWVGEDGVDAVVILAIDDMKDPKKYEAFLRPILRRLQKIDGRAPVSIMSCSVDPKDEQLQTWLKEGLSIECHTFDHPCPFFAKGFDKAKETYDRCVDLMHAIPNTRPVAFRMPCCDSMNTPSPRFWAEIFNKTTAKNNFLTIDSSVFNVFTSDDPALPRELVKDEKGGERFKRYLPLDRSFVNTIENYPYPYIIGKLCWEFPCMTPSDWQAQHLHKPNNPQTVADWKAALDCTVIKQGVFCMVFHPHGWIKNDQVIDFIDHAVAKHGKKVKFMTFKEAQARLNGSLFEEKDLRLLRSDSTNIVELVDINNDGYLDIQLSIKWVQGIQRIWVPNQPMRKWNREEKDPFKMFLISGPPIPSHLPIRYTMRRIPTKDVGILHIWCDGQISWVYAFEAGEKFKSWTRKFSLPPGAFLANRDGNDAGLRFIDLDGDGWLDVIFSNEREYGIYLFKDMKQGWSRKVIAGKAGDKDALPMISRGGTNNGFWVHSGHLWWSNEDTVLLKDHVDRRSIKQLLAPSP